MKLIKPFNPTIGTSGIIETGGINRNEQLLLFNDSYVGLALTFPDGSQDVLPGGWARDFIIPTMPMGQVKWSYYNTISNTKYNANQTYGAIYEPGEHILPVNSPIPRVLNTNVSSTDNLENDGNPPGTRFLEANPNDNPGNLASSALYITNDGNVLITDYKNSGLSIFEVLPNMANGTSNIVISDQNHQADVQGGLHLVSGAPIFTTSLNNVILNVPTGQKISLEVNGVEICYIDAAGYHGPGAGGSAFNGILTAPAATDIQERVDTGHKISFQVNLVEIAKVDANGITLASGNFVGNVTGNISAAVSSDEIINAPTSHKISLQINNVELAKIDNSGNGLQLASGIPLNVTAQTNLGALSTSGGITNTTGTVASPQHDVTNAGTGASPRFYANSTDGSMILQLPNGTDVLRFEVDGSITALGATSTLTAGLGSKAVKRSAFDDTGNDVYFKAPVNVIFQTPNGTTTVQFHNANGGSSLNTGGTASFGGDVKCGTNGSGLNNNYYYADSSKQSGVHQFTASSGVATNHGCNKTPQSIVGIPNGAATTQGITALTSTQVTVATGSGVSSYMLASTFN